MSQVLRGGLPVNAQQDRIVASMGSSRVTVVSAGAGTGKTHTTIAAALELVEKAGAHLDQFVLITFTRAAGDELRHRLEKVVASRVEHATSPEQRVFWQEQQECLTAAFVGTIHGFCRHVLRTYGYSEAIPHDSDIRLRTGHLIQRSKEEAIARYLALFEDRGEPPRLLAAPLRLRQHELLKRIEEIWSQARSRGINAGDLHAATLGQANDEGRSLRTDLAWLVRSLDQAYTEAKTSESVLDSDDLLVRTRDLLTSGDGDRIGRRIAQRFRYLCVDEFQDTDPTQKQIVKVLADHLAAVLVVGDEKQSIYGFRAAVVELLAELARENRVPILPLDESRRPTLRLLRAQGALFASMAREYPEFQRPLQVPSSTWTCEESFPPLLFLAAGGPKDTEQRIQRTAEQILACLGQTICVRKGADIIAREADPGDLVLLVRTNHIAATYEAVLRRLLSRQVDVRAEAGGGFYERPEIVSTYHMLRLLLHYPDDAALSLAFRTPYLRTADASAEEARLLQYGTRRGRYLVDWFEMAHPALAARIRGLHNDVRVHTVPEVLESLYRAFEIREYYRGLGDEQAASNLEKLREMVRTRFRDDQVLTLRHFVLMLQRNLLTRYPEEQAEVEEAVGTGGERVPYVRIMTVHRSKGLEFPIVIVPEVQQALMPEYRMPDFVVDPAFGVDARLPAAREFRTASAQFDVRATAVRRRQIEEEMRILYVAITRAQNQVILVGSNRSSPNAPENSWYSWQDEIVRARSALEAAGARFA